MEFGMATKTEYLMYLVYLRGFIACFLSVRYKQLSSKIHTFHSLGALPAGREKKMGGAGISQLL